ncbi:MAG: hypothetical protein B6I36_03550 [Desulfobacteraceae bacterium 4572_35.1]|nr:MAG: hypothetical protein B6I36_03550 [Desulfobacteraceae bacterium 4572_35.1]
MALAPEAETDDNQKKNGSTVYHKHGDGYTLSITISADEMSASISLKPEQKKEDLISVETLLDIISTHNIVDGIDMAVLTDICNKACAGKEQQNIVIATTHPPLPGADGWLEPLIQDKKLKFKEDDRGRVDLYTLNNIATVAIDQQIAILHPPQLGEASSTVTGKVLQPLAGKELEIRMGEGIRFDDDDATALSRSARITSSTEMLTCKLAISTSLDEPTYAVMYSTTLISTHKKGSS